MLLPPSLVDGKRYTVYNDTEIAELPPQILENLREADRSEKKQKLNSGKPRIAAQHLIRLNASEIPLRFADIMGVSGSVGVWQNVVCKVCGDSRTGTKQRGGLLLTTTGGFRYNCFNAGCQFDAGAATGWEPGRNLGEREIALYAAFGGDPAKLQDETTPPRWNTDMTDWWDELLDIDKTTPDNQDKATQRSAQSRSPNEEEQTELQPDSEDDSETGSKDNTTSEAPPPVYSSYGLQLRAGHIDKELNYMEKLLAESPALVFQRGGQLVEVTHDEKGHLKIHPLTMYNMIEIFTANMKIEAFDTRAAKDVRKNCPKDHAHVYLARGKWSFPALRATTSIPIMRRNGTILDTVGYDAATQIYYDPCGTVFPPIPETPTRDDALASLTAIKELVSEFPFVDKSDLSVFLSGVLSAVLRPSLPTVPMHDFTSPEAGTGKSTLIDLISIAVTGEPAAVLSQGYDEGEFEKRIGASLIAGNKIISVDNCSSALGGDLLCEAILQPTVATRILGKSELVKIPNTA